MLRRFRNEMQNLSLQICPAIFLFYYVHGLTYGQQKVKYLRINFDSCICNCREMIQVNFGYTLNDFLTISVLIERQLTYFWDLQ